MASGRSDGWVGAGSGQGDATMSPVVFYVALVLTHLPGRAVQQYQMFDSVQSACSRAAEISADDPKIAEVTMQDQNSYRVTCCDQTFSTTKYRQACYVADGPCGDALGPVVKSLRCVSDKAWQAVPYE